MLVDARRLLLTHAERRLEMGCRYLSAPEGEDFETFVHRIQHGAYFLWGAVDLIRASYSKGAA